MEIPNNYEKLPESCPKYSQNSTKKDPTSPIPHYHQRDFKIIVKEEIKEEDDNDGMMDEPELSRGLKDLCQDTLIESTSYRNPPERCPSPQDSMKVGHTILGMWR
ncbi:TPA: hypothetical protein GDO54_018579 [Pyxicephalus adspersus]|uniref:Uncharacterized protein n=1 Tax=Pyxicephalus adspersus TaxID=30357 RepID=A0AAV2ZDC5_PYXAD|nr:TPA: hypothetical protein GDO54_018579 [Pyxicephalus adspersus]